MIISCKAKTLLLLVGGAGLVVSSPAQTSYAVGAHFLDKIIGQSRGK
jgi:hypothetical protein